MQNVFHSDQGYIGVGPDWIERLKDVALKSPLRRARLCLHRSDDDLLHEMIIVLTRACVFRPHRHEAKSESYHMIEGRMLFIMFSNDGAPSAASLLTPPGQNGTVCFRMSDSIYHAVLPIDDIVVYQETTNGPFTPHSATIAPWAPTEPDELRKFLEKAAASFGVFAN
jgi:cupin fold WbuC family metalloprotein